MARRSLRLVAGFVCAGALSGLACSQSALLGASARQVPLSSADGGLLEVNAGDAPGLDQFKLVLHTADLPAGVTQIGVQLGPADEDPNSAGPSIVLTPAIALAPGQFADLILPYVLGANQHEPDLSVELEGGVPLRIDHSHLSVDTAARTIHCQIPFLGEVHALAVRTCKRDSECRSGEFCHDEETCRSQYLPDGGLDPELDGGTHHP